MAPPNLPASTVQPEHVRQCVRDASVSTSTQRHRALHLKAFFIWCEAGALCRSNPVEGTELPKRKKKVTQYLTPTQLGRLFRCIEADVELKAREDDLDGPVFVGYNGGRLNAEYASKKFKQYVRLAKLPESIHFHSLRHTCASWLVQRGVSLSIVQQILGHSSIQVTQRYAHLAPDVMQAAIRQAFGGEE